MLISPDRTSLFRAAMPLLGLALWILPPLPSRAQDIPVTVEDAVRMAVENNLDLRVQTFNPAIAATGIQGARGIYDTQLATLLEYRVQNRQAIPDSDLVARRQYFDFDVTLQQLVPSGGTASAAFFNAWYQDNFGTSLSDYAQPHFAVSFSQPILRGLGKEVTEQGITLATDCDPASVLGEQIAAALLRDGLWSLSFHPRRRCGRSRL